MLNFDQGQSQMILLLILLILFLTGQCDPNKRVEEAATVSAPCAAQTAGSALLAHE